MEDRSALGLFLVVSIVVFSAVSTTNQSSVDRRSLSEYQSAHVAKPLSDFPMRILQEEINESRFWNLLQPILIQRIPGTSNSTKVKNLIRRTLENLGYWNVTYDSFHSFPPRRRLTKFTNIIATTNPSASRKLVLACHYDSKLLLNQYFEAATDSAVPCAMLLEMAHVLRPLIIEHSIRQHLRVTDVDVSLDLIFFDGEEAFVKWSATDSLYGSRHLAAKWADPQNPIINKIDLFVLLDLIGHEGTAFSNYTITGTRWYDNMVDIERRLNRASYISTSRSPIFRTNQFYRHASIEDDHIPFIRRRSSLPVLHLISTPFPPGWHTVNDNKQSLNQTRSSAVLRIVTQFVAEYLHFLNFSE